MVGGFEISVQEIKRTLATHLPLRLPFCRNTSFSRHGFGPTGIVHLSLSGQISFTKEWKCFFTLPRLETALNSRARRLVAVGDAHNLKPVTGQQLNHDVAGAAYRRVQTLRFLYIRLPPWDRLALQSQ
jgi:hypothetical protein